MFDSFFVFTMGIVKRGLLTIFVEVSAHPNKIQKNKTKKKLRKNKFNCDFYNKNNKNRADRRRKTHFRVCRW